VQAPRVQADAVRAAADTGEDEERLLADDRRARLVACLDGRRAPRAGRRTTLAVDHHELHFFDPATGDVLDARPALAPSGLGEA
jgi:multiple sugar transport system ATP-binding protein